MLAVRSSPLNGSMRPPGRSLGTPLVARDARLSPEALLVRLNSHLRPEADPPGPVSTLQNEMRFLVEMASLAVPAGWRAFPTARPLP